MITRALWLVVFALALGMPGAAQVADESTVPRISVPDLKKAADAGQVLIVDVRDPRSYADGHIPGAINVTLGDLQKQAAALKAAKKAVVTYCS
jgi:rhodanese-related sulfurtransferase